MPAARHPAAATDPSRSIRWAWSSCRAHVGLAEPPPWLDVAGLHGHMLGREARTAADRRTAARRYAAHVAAGSGQRLWDSALRHQIDLGDDDLVQRMLDSAAQAGANASAGARRREILEARRIRPVSLAQWRGRCDTREEAMYRTYTESGLTMTAIAQALGLSVSRVSRLISR